MNTLTSDDLIRDPIGRFPAATVACFDPTEGDLPRRRLDASRTIRFLERLSELHAPAVLIAASTGHGHLRTVEELAAWFQIAARANLAATVLEALLRPEDGIDANRRLVATLADLGYPIAFVRPGRDLSPHAPVKDVAKNMQPVVRAAAERGLAVGIYSIPDVSGVALTPEAALILVAGPGGDRIVAVKVTEANYDTSTLCFLQHPDLGHLKIVQGWDTHLARALRDGPQWDSQGRQRCGITSGAMSLAVHQYLHILAAAARADWDEVTASQTAVTLLFRAMQDDPNKFADLQRAKFIMGLGHPLTGTVTPEKANRVMESLHLVERPMDRARLARSLDLMADGPFHAQLLALS